MKAVVCALTLGVIVLTSNLAAACEKPASKPEIPDAATVVTAQMVKANNDMKAYVKSVQDYIGCAGLSRADEKKEIDDLKNFAEDFNQVVRAYKARAAG